MLQPALAEMLSGSSSINNSNNNDNSNSNSNNSGATAGSSADGAACQESREPMLVWPSQRHVGLSLDGSLSKFSAGAFSRGVPVHFVVSVDAPLCSITNDPADSNIGAFAMAARSCVAALCHSWGAWRGSFITLVFSCGGSVSPNGQALSKMLFGTQEALTEFKLLGLLKEAVRRSLKENQQQQQQQRPPAASAVSPMGSETSSSQHPASYIEVRQRFQLPYNSAARTVILELVVEPCESETTTSLLALFRRDRVTVGAYSCSHQFPLSGGRAASRGAS
ncbi:unnamed protein product [Polarella glacialis]|uniref:Uncharacterized protein n=1 Tax=Polarella glacialis TaxID=89957 RepID=A0A813EFH6_POLGL|nr:unnamed protein product [Polarella glacialis]